MPVKFNPFTGTFDIVNPDPDYNLDGGRADTDYSTITNADGGDSSGS